MEVPTGAIPYIENQWSHHEFVTAVQPQYALVKITTARALHDEYGETADSYYGEDTKVITTTTITDSTLNLLSWEKEFDIVHDFDPAFHIPCDYSTYEDADPEERTENVSNYLEGTITMQRWLREASSETQILPLIKGVTDEERDRAVATLEPHEFPGYVFYGTQYFTSGDGILINELVADVTATTRGHDRPLLLIGCLSPNFLQRMPRQVVAGSGVQRWRMHIKPRKQEPAEMREAWAELRGEVSTALAAPPETESESGSQPPAQAQPQPQQTKTAEDSDTPPTETTPLSTFATRDDADADADADTTDSQEESPTASPTDKPETESGSGD
ncbi:hypothetical protein [Halococcus thailandensis]|uniref:Uncharacterized protein n=1 Tax=Halococcus thailandensis JCM 13552 TaxID=1227457 RepID=M0NE27_9EURY|nr:hypothetical protein [Halococcus thailandensis]EMA56237.1 hypothetical protein C451_03444 [Halococcus thailandensis JCM 13552]